MIAPLARFIDWSAIQALTVLELNNSGQNPRLEEALQFLKGPDFIPVESQPAQIVFVPTNRDDISAFPRRDRANSRKTTSFMAGSTAAPGAGRIGR